MLIAGQVAGEFNYFIALTFPNMRQLIRSLLFATACCASLTVAQAQNPVAYYAFSGNANDAKGNHAAVQAARLTTDRFGSANSAFLLDGTQAYLEAPNQPALNSDYTTVAFWAKPTALPGQGEVYLISFGGWQERYKISLPAHGKCIWTTNSTSGISDMDAGDGNALTPGVWKHLVFVHDGVELPLAANRREPQHDCARGSRLAHRHVG